MPSATTGLARRIPYLLHVGCVELRNLALGQAPHQQIADLADALETLPRFLRDDISEDDWSLVRFVVENYNAHYPHSGWRLFRGLDYDPPERY